MNKRQAVAVGTAVAVGVGLIALGAQPDVERAKQGAWSASCPFTGQILDVDPVVFHGQAQSPHVHQFYGMGSITADTTYDDLRAGTSLCTVVPDPENVPDHNGYWTPAMYKTAEKLPGTVVVGTGLVAYFRTRGFDPATIQVPPEGFNLVAGNGGAMVDGDNPHIEWSCASEPGPPEIPSQTIPPSCPVQDVDGTPYRLRLGIHFPSCYLGDVVPGSYNYGKAAENRLPALRYPDVTEGALYPLTCPAGYQPIGIIDLVFRYYIGNFPRLDNGTPDDPADDSFDLTGATLASDNMLMTMPDGSQMLTGGHGLTAHADFMSGYTLAENTQLVDNCFHVPHTCGIITGVPQ